MIAKRDGLSQPMEHGPSQGKNEQKGREAKWPSSRRPAVGKLWTPSRSQLVLNMGMRSFKRRGKSWQMIVWLSCIVEERPAEEEEGEQEEEGG